MYTTTTSVTLTWLTTGSKTVTVNYNNSFGCDGLAAATNTITVNLTPTASISAPTDGCAETGVNVQFTGTAGSTISYNIGSTPQTPVQIDANGDNILVPTSTNADTYTYTITSVTLGNGCPGIITNASVIVAIHALPTVAAIGGPSIVKVGEDITLTDATPNGVWSSSNIGQATVAASLVHGVAPGTPTISYTVSNTFNGTTCSAAATKPITVYSEATSGYITKQDGNFNNASTWQISVGSDLLDATVPPTATNPVTVKNQLTLNTDFNTASNFTITTGGSMLIAPNHYFGSTAGTIDFGGNLVIVQSDNTGTGAIGSIAGTIGSATHVRVERYIGAGDGTQNGKRAWRLLTSPVTGVTINASWQEGLVAETTNPAIGDPNYGTLISGRSQQTAATAFSHGYDFWPAIVNGNSSIRYYQPDAGNGLWNSLPGNGLKGLNIEVYPAYMLYVRGNRSIQTTGFGPTTLRAEGTLKQGSSQPAIAVPGSNGFTLIGNPYASPIDFEQVYTNLNTSGIRHQFYIWSASLSTYGAFELVNNNGSGYTIVPKPFTPGTEVINNNARYIPSGAGFFIVPTSAAGGSVTIDESAKAPTQTALVNPYRGGEDLSRKLWINLNLKDSTSSTLADGVLAQFDASYSDDVNSDDAIKQENFNENLSIVRHANSLIIEARPEVQATDTVQLKLSNVTKRNYQLQLKADKFTSGVQAWVEDNYLGSKQPVDLSGGITTLDFTITSDSASWKSDRFRVVFQNSSVLPVTLTSVKAAPQNGGVQVSWTVTNEVNMKGYTIERSTDGGSTYNVIATQTAKNNTAAALTNYAGFDAAPQQGDNLYRIKIESKEGNISYSQIVKVTLGEDRKDIQITMYPNPVRKEGKVNLQLTNLAEGSYLLRVYSEGGQSVYQRKVTISQSNTTQSETLSLGSQLAQGSYQVHITNSKGVTLFTDKLIITR